MLSQSGIEQKRSKYRILGLVGQGQFGRVYCAIHRQSGRLVALKSLEHRRFPTHKFLRELRFLLSLQHPNIVTCQALEHTHTGRYLVMDYCEGGTLRNLVDKDMRLSLPQSLKLVADILAGLDHAHSRGIVHCDIKPENILLNVQPYGWTARISDFGIARLSQEMLDQTLGNTGSPAYMSPERFYGQYSLTSDLYSVGILLFELIAGYRPFSGTPSELMSAHLNQPLKLPDSIPEVWHPLLITALQKLSARRFQSAREMLSALLAIAATEGLEPGLEVSSDQVPLLRSTVTLPVCPFKYSYLEGLQHPVTHLAIAPARQDSAIHEQPSSAGAYLLRAEETQLIYQAATDNAFSESEGDADQAEHFNATSQAIAFKAPIQNLLVYNQGCLVVTDQKIYQITTVNPSNTDLALHPVLEQDGGITAAAVEPQGQWLACASFAFLSANAVQLSFLQLPTTHASIAVARQPIQLAIKHKQTDLSLKLLALDSRHVAVMAASPIRGEIHAANADSLSTTFEVFTRRGDRIGSLQLPVLLKQAILTPTPYRLLATDCSDTYSVLFIDLKPFRVLRLAVDITPEFLQATAWGYIVANSMGQLVLLDRDGQQINRIDVPIGISAIAPTGKYGLYLATWNNGQSHLYGVNLQQLGADFLF